MEAAAWNRPSPARARRRSRRPFVIITTEPGDRVEFFIHPKGRVVISPKLFASALRCGQGPDGGYSTSRILCLRSRTRSGHSDRVEVGGDNFCESRAECLLGHNSRP